MIQVLDKGYVRLVRAYGSDLDVANAARASYAKESLEFSEKDARLIRFLAEGGHSSPFRHVLATFEVKAPLIVARQWWKYVVGSDHTMETSWNEASRRYITMEPEFYIPDIDEWRTKPANSKQGSGPPLGTRPGHDLTRNMRFHIEESIRLYEEFLAFGVAPEQARLLLPAYAMYTIWRWTASIQGIAFFLSQRLEDDAQKEMRDYARAVHQLIEPHFPVSISSLVGNF